MNGSSKVTSLLTDLKLRISLEDELSIVFADKQADLSSGTYTIRYVANKKLAYKKTPHIKQFVAKISQPSYLKRNIRQCIINKFKQLFDYLLIRKIHFINQSSPNEFAGELVMVTREDDVKIFDFKSEKVKTYLNTADYEKQKENYEHFKAYFNLTIIDLNDQEASITEQLIPFKTVDKWTLEEMRDMFQDMSTNFINYGTFCRKKLVPQQTIPEIIDNCQAVIDDMTLMTMIENYLKMYDLELPFSMVRGHGDFTTNNILLHNETYYVIDWEDARDYVFYYDLFNLFFVDYLHTNNQLFLNYYLEGHLDEQLEKLFHVYGIHYYPHKKIAYLLIFICERLAKFETKKSGEHLNQVIRRYETIVTELTNIG